MGKFPKDAHTYHKDICSTMFIVALFIIARAWKQPRCPSAEEWIKKNGTFTHYATVKKNDILKIVGKWMELEKKSS